MALTREGFRHYDYDRMVVRKWHVGSAPLPWTTWMDRLEGVHHHVAGAYLCGMRKSGLGGDTAVCRTMSKSTASQRCL
jgi:hypothetical protein